MRHALARLSLILCILLTAAVAHAGHIEYVVSAASNPGQGTGSTQRYTYFLEDITLGLNQELSIAFLPDLFGSLTNGVGPSGFDIILFQPDNPPGSTGYFSALSLADNQPGTLSFSVDFTFIGSGQPGSQPFAINQYDENGRLLGVLDSGRTTSLSGVPEPGTLGLGGLVLIAGGVLRAVRRRWRRTA